MFSSSMSTDEAAQDDVILVQICQLATRKMIIFPHKHYSAELAAELSRPVFDHSASEWFMALGIDRNQKMRNLVHLAVGHVNLTLTKTKQALQASVASPYRRVVLIHNHIDNDTTPSPSDVQLARRVSKQAKEMGIAIIDFLIIGNDYGHLSMRDKGFV